MRSKWVTFNDGLLQLAHDRAGYGSFGNRRNVDGLDDLEVYEQAHYADMTIRTEDVAFAEQTGTSLARKVRIRNVPELTVGDKAVIEDTVYNVGSLDRSADKTQAFLYLERVREVR